MTNGYALVCHVVIRCAVNVPIPFSTKPEIEIPVTVQNVGKNFYAPTFAQFISNDPKKSVCLVKGNKEPQKSSKK